jgi:hypothetical protein
MQRAKQFNDIDGVSPMFSMKWLTTSELIRRVRPERSAPFFGGKY